jgi:hypothetical protein
MNGTTMMAADRVHAPVGFGGAFVHQVRLLWTSRRPLLLLVAALGLLALVGEPWRESALSRLLDIWPVFVALIGPIWAFVVLHNEGPSNRLYHWSQPVGRRTHTLARLAAGLAWLWGVYLLVGLAAFAFATFDGTAWQLRQLGALAWINFFTAPLLGYLAVSILTVASDYPIRWFFGLLFLAPMTLAFMSNRLGLEQLVETIIRPLIDHNWGFIGALGSAFAHGFAGVMDRMPQHSASFGPFDPGTWILATLGWAVGLAAVVLFMASLHPDRLPRLQLPGRRRDG